MILLSYLFYFIAATIAPIQRRWLSTRNEGGNKINLSFKVTFVAALLILLLPLFSPFELQGPYTTIILLLIAAAIGGVGYYVSYFTAQRHVEAGVTSVLQNIYTPITIVLSTVFLGEGLQESQILGTILLLVAAVIVSKKHRIGRISFDKYFWLMIFSGISLSVLLVANRELMKITGFTASVVLSYWTVCIGLGVLTFLTKGVTTYTKKDIVITGSLKFLQDLSWAMLTFFVANLSLASSVTTFKIVIMFIVAAAFLGEKGDLQRKIVGSLIAVAGLLLMG
jgi:drug/metabolite transporter (DMT)-like permease